MPLASGTRLGPYELVSLLGAGGMGEVYRAHDRRLGRDVAIKLLPERLASSPDRLARFEREARTVAGLNHPHIVTLHTIEQEGDVRFLVMEMVEGRDLSTLIEPRGLSLAQVLDLAIPLADALVAAHERRVVHRDLKPSNVMLTRDGHLKVLDFGLAKLMEDESGFDETRTIREASITDAGKAMGTVPYMAPEQIRGEEVDSRADLFAFGIMVYELASGRRPFGGESSADITSSILRDAPPSLSTLRSDLPGDLGRILERCLEKNPRERFQTALDVANELRALKRVIDRGGSAPARPSPESVASIAVLPFVNRSASAEDEYFSDGLADELLSLLAKIRGLRVSARSSSFRFKGKDATAAEMGHALGVATILEGSVRKSGTRVRISVQLVKVSDGFPLWSETYDRSLDDIFAVQDDIARSVVKELRSALLGEIADSKASGEVKAEIAMAARGRSSNPEAYRLYLQACHLHDSGGAGVAKALECLNQAVALDPGFAIAWVQMANAHMQQTGLGLVDLNEGYERAREALERALSIEPEMPEALRFVAKLQMRQEWDWSGAEATLQRITDLRSARSVSAELARVHGRFDEAIVILRKSLQHDPLSSPLYHNLGSALFRAGRFADAEEVLRKALSLSPGRSRTHAYLSLTLLYAGRGEEGLAEAAKEPHGPFRLWAEAIIQQVLHGREASDEPLRRLIEKHGDIALRQIADVYAVREEWTPAFEWLERAYALRDPGLLELKGSPMLRRLHGDPRWHALLKKMHLEN